MDARAMMTTMEGRISDAKVGHDFEALLRDEAPSVYRTLRRTAWRVEGPKSAGYSSSVHIRRLSSLCTRRCMRSSPNG
jgi:hypothetical protein